MKIGLVLLLVLMFGCSKSTIESEDANAAKFQSVLQDWGVSLPNIYKVTHAAESEGPLLRGGPFLSFFRLSLTKDQAAELLEDPNLAHVIRWHDAKDSWRITPEIHWWKVDEGSKVYGGFLEEKKKTGSIWFYVIVDSINPFVLVRAYDRPSERKYTRD